MFRRLGFYSDEMLLAFAVWLCNLPLVALVVIPTFGWWAAGVTALALFFVFLVICWGVCGWKIANSPVIVCRRVTQLFDYPRALEYALQP